MYIKLIYPKLRKMLDPKRYPIKDLDIAEGRMTVAKKSSTLCWSDNLYLFLGLCAV